MRILYLNPCGHMGGAETSLHELLAGIRCAEPDWDLWLVLGEDGPLAQRARKLGVQVLVVPFPAALAGMGDAGQGRALTAWPLFRAAVETAFYRRRLGAVCRTIQPDVIHTNGLKMHLLGTWALPCQCALVWHIHDYLSARPLMRRLLRWRRKRCTAAIANSKSVAADLQALLPGERIVPIYNAVNLERFAPAGRTADLDALSGLPAAQPGTVRVGLIATFARWKGHTVFLEALAKLSAETPVRGYVIGGPIYQTGGSQWTRQELEGHGRRLGLAGKVGFTGFLDDTAEAMRSLDIVVHASTQPEPFGMVIAEGMACGKPVIVSEAGGAAELFEDGRTALGYPPGDAAALARQIERLTSDENLRSRLGQAARAATLGAFRGRRMAGEVASLYRECVVEARKAAA